MAVMVSDQYMSVARAAKVLGIGEWRIRYYLRNPQKFPTFPYAKTGSGKIMVRPGAVKSFLDSRDELEVISGDDEGGA